MLLCFCGVGEEHVYGMLCISSRVQDLSLYAYGANIVVVRTGAADVFGRGDRHVMGKKT